MVDQVVELVVVVVKVLVVFVVLQVLGFGVVVLVLAVTGQKVCSIRPQ